MITCAKLPSRRCGLTAVSDYTLLGVDKIAQQARRDLTLIRCPRDSVVMRVTACRARRKGAGDSELRFFDRAPRGSGWHVCSVDVECPACKRRAMAVTLEESAADAALVPEGY